MAHFCPLWISSKWLIFNILVSYCSVICLLISYTLLSCFFSLFLLLLMLFFLLLLLFFIQSSLSVLRDWFQDAVLWMFQWHSQSSASVVPYTRFSTCSFISSVQRANCTCHSLLSSPSPPILDYPLFYSAFFPSSCFPFSCLLGYKLPFIRMKFLLQRDFLAVSSHSEWILCVRRNYLLRSGIFSMNYLVFSPNFEGKKLKSINWFI